MTRIRIFCAAFPALVASAALAQSSAVSVPQLSSPRLQGVAATSQADTAAAAHTRREREALVSTGAPIGEGRRSAEAPPALSTRADSRAIRADPVGGRDRCDAPGAVATSLCRLRLEARADEFHKPSAAPVTAEGRLLVLTDPQDAPMTVDEATRRLGSAPGVDALAGGAASELAGAISGGAAGVGLTGGVTATSGASATALPAGAPVVVLSPK